MTRKRRRLYIVLAGMAVLGSAAALALTAFEDNLVFFYSPSDVQAREMPADKRMRIGGLVEEESVVKRGDGLTTDFRVTDLAASLPVSYKGILPDLFREGQGVVVEGSLDTDGTFIASNVLAKHDENYMPPEVAEALKKSGRWEEGKAQ
ncbi:MAG: cytochrome c maturation protein CcmE [Rhodospirillaceae bacterium]|nr:cytochrome c maturation protein CcmE [Rhodospirillaceae bacterium]